MRRAKLPFTMSQQQRDHVKRYGESLRIWKEKNMGERMCHDLASETARTKFKLSDDEQKEVDAWLDERYPMRRTRTIIRRANFLNG